MTCGDRARGDVLSPEAALKSNVELLKLLGVDIVYGQYKLPHCTLEGNNLKLSFVQEPAVRGYG